jgi:hypothetical protein
MADVPQKDASTGRFLTGNNGGGRPKGARSKLGEAFLQAVLDDFANHGVAAIQDMRAKNPGDYAKMVASILPKEIEAGEETINILAELLARIDGRTRTIVPALPFTPRPEHTAH